jgi:type I site-specific restriction endonuclease
MSPVTEEDKVREIIDDLLSKAGWGLYGVADANILAG